MKKSKNYQPLHIYLDACCFNRPFDDQTHDRIRIEAESVIILLRISLTGKVKLVGSDVLKHEINKTPDPVRKSQLLSLLNYISKFYSLNDRIVEMARKFQKSGFGSFDSLHLAVAQINCADVFATTDDRMLKLYRRKPDLFTFRIDNPVNIVRELIL
ncbi:MAG TPA: PIN domain-containing protein [Spirochaetota bacterium]|mgnify:CR=1 FL=1|nr:PIN domain-containing protein [Spirochaetota bacterium]